MDPVKINIRIYATATWRQRLAAPALQVSVIGIGAVLDSAAMQWAGFLILALLLAVGASTVWKKDNDLTIDQARARLDEIEAQQKENL